MPTKVKGTTGVDKVEAGAVITNPSFSGNATVTGSLTVGGVNVFSGPYRNLIINGDMRIAQRGTSATGLTNGSTGYHTIDRFAFNENGVTSSVWTQTQDTTVPTGQGFTNSFKLQCTTAQSSLNSDNSLSIRQMIEAQNLQHLKYGTSSAETLTLSFWVKSNKTGTYTFWIYQEDSARDFSQTYTIDSADTWEKKTITIDGDTVGQINNDNGSGLFIGWYLLAGTDFTSGTFNTSWNNIVTANRVSPSQVNLADSTSNYINITGVQLEVGSGASDFEFLPYDVQLARCQRYFEKSASNSNSYPIGGFGYVFAAGSIACGYTFNTAKRNTPSISLNTLVSRGGQTNGSNTSNDVSSISSIDSQVPFTSVTFIANLATTNIAVGTIAGISNSSSNSYIYFDAEL